MLIYCRMLCFVIVLIKHELFFPALIIFYFNFQDLEQDKKPEKLIIKVIYLEGFLHYNSFASEKTNLQFSSQNT